MNLAEVWSQTLSILADKLPWFLALLIALGIYELMKKGARAAAAKLGEKASGKWLALGVLVLMALLIAVLRVQGYI